MSKTLNDLIAKAVLGAQEMEEDDSLDVSPSAEGRVPAAEAVSDDHEKLASVLELIGRRGVENIVKLSGQVENNAGRKPGGGAAQADISGSEPGTHNPNLKSNEAAIALPKSEHAKEVTPALKQVLKATPFADPAPKALLAHADSKTDKNINKKAHDLEAVRAELARRVAAGGA